MPFGSVTLNDGNKAPVIAFGTGGKYVGREFAEHIEQALELGFSHVDTATYYGNEESVQDALHETGLPREAVYITSKYGGPKKARDACEESLSKLGLKQVDMYLIHFPPNNLEDYWRQFEELKEAGLTKSIGVSNFNVEQLKTVVKSAKIKPAVNQISFNPYSYAEHKPLLEYAAKHRIQIEAYSSLAPITKYPGGPVDAPVAAAAKRIGGTPAQVIFSWVRSKGVTLVTTTTSKERMKQYLDTADLPALTQEEIDAIDRAAAKGPSTKFGGIVYKGLILLCIIMLISLYVVRKHYYYCVL